MSLKVLSFGSVIAMLAASLVATVSAAEKPAAPPKKPTIDKKILAVPKKPFIHKELMAAPGKAPTKKMLFVAPRGPMSGSQGIEARLQRLEKKLDAVMRELQQLRRELRTRPPMPGMLPPGAKPDMHSRGGPHSDQQGRPPHGPHPPLQPGGPAGAQSKDSYGGHHKIQPRGGTRPSFGGEKPQKGKPKANTPKA